MNALYIGRFHIFHKGHLDMVKFIDAEKDVDKITIAIGSAQYSRNKEHPYLPSILNPFTFDERKTMLEMALEGETKKPVNVIGVNDLHVCDMWYNLVIHSAKPDVFYSNSKKEKRLFESNNFPIRVIPIKKMNYHAHTIREMIAHDNGWRGYVPKGTARFVEKFNIDRLLADFFSQHEKEIEEVRAMQRRDGIEPYEDGKKY